jgi:hypothetical protein
MGMAQDRVGVCSTAEMTAYSTHALPISQIFHAIDLMLYSAGVFNTQVLFPANSQCNFYAPATCDYSLQVSSMRQTVTKT